MPHDTPLIATLAIGFALAFVFGLVAQRVRLPPIAGYLLAGCVIGPFTPGFVADAKLAAELAEIGVILLMFGVGLHFSLADLVRVRTIAVPGALGQIAAATLMGWGLAAMLGWSFGAGLLFGLALSVASTVVLLRALQERGRLESEDGRIAVGWLVVEDLVMVLALVLLPPLAGLLGGAPSSAPAGPPLWATLSLTAGKIGLFVLVMLVIGRRAIPWLMHYVAHTGSRELFRLSVLAIALGVAYGSAKLFGVSFALGAFFAGMVLAESQLSQQAAKETLPMRDAFAVLFFVSVGMLLDPAVILRAPLAVIGTAAIIIFGKSAVAWLIVRAFGHPNHTALTIAASLAQIGEFSFILIVLGVQLAIVPADARDLIVAGAILSILLNPLLFRLVERLAPPPPASAPVAATPILQDPAATQQTGHAVIAGHGAAGARMAAILHVCDQRFIVVDTDPQALAGPAALGIETHLGLCGEPAVLARLNLPRASLLIAAIPDPYEAGHLIEAARAANPTIRTIAIARTPAAAEYLKKLGVDEVLEG